MRTPVSARPLIQQLLNPPKKSHTADQYGQGQGVGGGGWRGAEVGGGGGGSVPTNSSSKLSDCKDRRDRQPPASAQEMSAQEMSAQQMSAQQMLKT